MTPLPRPRKPAPLNVLSEESKAEWRKYLSDCAYADNPAFSASAPVRDVMSRRPKPPRQKEDV